MKLTEKESNVLNYLRNLSYRVHTIMQGNNSPVNDLSDEELLFLYNKMDAIIEDEGNFRQSLGDFDEMYVLELSGVENELLKEIKRRGIHVKEKKKMPTIDDLCQALENAGETELSDQLHQTALASRLLNPLLDVSFPEEMQDKLTVFRTPGISECIIFDSIEDVFNNKGNYEMYLKNIHDKGYFENVALKYLKALPSNITYHDAKYNIHEIMEKVEQYPLLKNVLIHINPVETVRTGLDLIGSKVALRYQITVSDVLSQLSGGDKDA